MTFMTLTLKKIMRADTIAPALIIISDSIVYSIIFIKCPVLFCPLPQLFCPDKNVPTYLPPFLRQRNKIYLLKFRDYLYA